MSKKVTVLGFYGKKNTGDEAYKLAFPLIFPNFDFHFTDKLENVHDYVFLGGGNVLQSYFINQLSSINIPKYAMSVNAHAKDVAKYSHIFEKMFIRNMCEGVKQVPDYTFVLSPDRQNGKNLIRNIFQSQKADLYSRVIVVVMNAYVCSDHASLARDHINFDKVCYDLAKIMDTTSASFLFLPFGNGFPHNDRIANSFLYSKCKFWNKNAILYDEITVLDTLDIMAACNMSIGTRLHSAIFSCIGGTPFIDIGHHDKSKLFLETINKDWGINYWHFNSDKTKALIDDFLVNEDSYREELLKIAARNKDELTTLQLEIL